MKMYLKVYTVFFLLLRSLLTTVATPTEVLLLISSEDLPHQRQQSESLRRDLLRQSTQLALIRPGDYVINVQLMHEIFNYPGDWTLLATLPHLLGETRLLNDNTKWIILCQDNTYVSLQRLLERLERENSEELSFYGYALHDQEATIIHHFAFFENPTWFPYPMLGAGIVFTARLLRSLARLVADNKISRHSEFSIDAAHELARFIFDHITPAPTPTVNDGHKGRDDNNTANNNNMHISESEQKSHKIILKSAAYICPTAPMSSPSPMPLHKVNESCLMYAQPELSDDALAVVMRTAAGARAPVTDETDGGAADAVNVAAAAAATTCRSSNGDGKDIYFAIKTCAKFHKERIPIIESTWANYAVHRNYYSDVTDLSIPTVGTGVPNVETGHCAKILAILQLSLKDIEEQMKRKRAQIRWIALVDDDTLLSVSRLSALLACLDEHSDLYLGERYGYRLHEPDGFNYHTGGAGIVLSLPLARRVLARCSCPSPTAPDDMILGYCLQALGVAAWHSSRFHQARPQDYPRELLRHTAPISFHKFWQSDPLAVYATWFAAADRKLLPVRRQRLRPAVNNVSLGLHKPRRFKKDRQLLAANIDERLTAHMAFEHSRNKHLDL